MKILILLITLSTGLIANDFTVSGDEYFHFYGASESAQLKATTKAENICRSNVTRLSNWKLESFIKEFRTQCYGCIGYSYKVKFIKATASFECL